MVDQTLGHTSGSREPDFGNPLPSQATLTNTHTTYSGKNRSTIGHVQTATEVGPDCGNGVGRLS